MLTGSEREAQAKEIRDVVVARRPSLAAEEKRLSIIVLSSGLTIARYYGRMKLAA